MAKKSPIEMQLPEKPEPGAVSVVGVASKSLLGEQFLGEFGANIGGRSNPMARRMDVRPVSWNSADNDFVPRALKDPWVYDLLDEMRDRNTEIGGAVRTMAARVCGRKIYVHADDPKDERQTKAVAFVQSKLVELGGTFGFRNYCRSAVVGAVAHGIGAAEVVWKMDGSSIVPAQIIHRHPGQFEFDSLGNAFLYAAGEKSQTTPLAPSKFPIVTLPALYGNPFGESMLWPLRWIYYIQKNATTAWAEGVETYGLPVLMVTVGPNVQDRENAEETIREFLENLRRESGIVVPEGITLTAESRGAESGRMPHPDLIQYLDRAAVRYITGSTLSTMENQGTGSLAQSTTHADVSDEVVVPIILAVQDTVQSAIVAPMVAWEFGTDFPAPRLCFEIERPLSLADKKLKYDAAKEHGVSFSETQFREDMGVAEPYDDDDAIVAVGEARDIYKYHIDSGVVTENEVRERLLLDPVPGGDKPVSIERLTAVSGIVDAGNTQQFSRDSRIVSMAALRAGREHFAEQHEFATTQIDMPEDVRERIAGFQSLIPQADLAEEGIETRPHVTVLYGLDDSNVADVRRLIEDFGTVGIEFGPLFLFENDVDVLCVSVKGIAIPAEGVSPIESLNARIDSSIPNGNKHPVYVPHLCIAYLNKGAGKKYLALESPLRGLPVSRSEFVSFITTTGEEFALSTNGEEFPVISAHFSKAKFSSASRRRMEMRYVRFMDAVSEEIYKAMAPEYAKEVRRAAKVVGDAYPSDRVLDLGATTFSTIGMPPVSEDKLLPVVAAVRAMAVGSIRQAAEARGGVKKRPPAPPPTRRVVAFAAPGSVEELPSPYREGLEWMLDRGVATVPEIELVARELAATTAGLTEAQIKAQLRKEFVALAGAPSEEMTAKFVDLIAENVAQGKTVADFLSEVDALTANGSLPANMDNYLHTVYRTETAHVYEAQRQENVAQMAGLAWGREFFNPDDDRSRESHAAMDGVIVQFGSAADQAAGELPWSYNCRCTWAPVFVGEVSEESPDAFERALAIERFACDHSHGERITFPSRPAVKFSKAERAVGFSSATDKAIDCAGRAFVDLVPVGNGEILVLGKYTGASNPSLPPRLVQFSMTDEGPKVESNLARAFFAGTMIRVPIRGAEKIALEGKVLWRLAD